jgi:hypothetical protein
MRLSDHDAPLAVTMWDFSWLERRGDDDEYADWDQVLDELVERGYDAVRIDAYPHFVASDPTATWQLPPAFEACEWGATNPCEVQVEPALTEFVGKCADRNVSVALSSWFRQDAADVRLDVECPQDLGEIWIETLDRIDGAGLLDTLCWVDLCNEFPLPEWAPWYTRTQSEERPPRDADEARRWIDESIETVREAYPEQDYTLSETSGPDAWHRDHATEMDLLELHVWLMNATDWYDFEAFDHGIDSEAHYRWLVETGSDRYRDGADRWQVALQDAIGAAAAWSRETGLPLATTECWGPIHFRDQPGLDWAWVKDICAVGTQTAAQTGRWAAIATSNFCGPQYRGMWEDVEWHREQTTAIKSASVEV